MISNMCGTPKRLSASGAVATGSGLLTGYLVNSTTAGTITLTDTNDAALGTAFAVALPTTAGQFVPLGASFSQGLYFTLGGTADITFFVAV